MAASATLIGALRAELEARGRASSQVRPEVVDYLLGRGLAPLHEALAKRGDPDATCQAVWRLMLSSVEARRFGVSTDAWSTHDDYPDRYFPLLWLRLLPSLLPALPADEGLACAAALFNLGEKLCGPLRATGNRLMAGLAERPAALLPDWRRGLEDALVRFGLLDVPPLPPEAWRGFDVVGTFDFRPVEADFLPGSVEAGEARSFRVGDPELLAVGLLLADQAGLSLVSLDTAAPPPARLASAVPGGRVTLDRRRLLFTPANGGAPRCLCPDVPLLAPAAVAANAAGDLLLVDAASAHVLLGRVLP